MDHTSRQETMDEATLQSDLESLVRVRNRLAHSPTSAVPKILTGLLPRLLVRLERNHICLLGATASGASTLSTTSTTSASNYKSTNIVTAAQRALMDKCQAQLTGILTHALERIRVGRRTMPHGAPWVHSLVPLLLHQNEKDWQSPVATTFLLLILRDSFPLYVESIYDSPIGSSAIKGPEEQPDIIFAALPALSQFVNAQHHKILTATTATAQETTSTVGASTTTAKLAISESMLLSFRTASWLCFDVLALSWGLPALIDWDRDHFDEYEWSTPCCSSAKEAFLEHGPSRHPESDNPPATAFLEHAGNFQLWLDLLLFWPPEKDSRQRHRRVVRTAADMLVENSTGMTSEGLKRMNHRCKEGQTWNPRYLRELKLACMHSVVVEPLRSLPDNVESLEDLEDNLPLLRSLILCIVTSSTGSMHGKVALEYVNKMGLRFAARSYRAQLPSYSDSWACGDTSIDLACSLLTLVLGDEISPSVLDKHPKGRAKIEAILGQSPTSGEDNDAPSKMLQRAPMPFGVAERAIDFILTRLLPASVEEGTSPSALKPVTAKGGEKSTQFGTLPVFVDLVVALSTSKGTIGSYWAIQCLDALYSQFSVLGLQSGNFKGMVGLFVDGNWMQEFNTTCLEIASRVLSQIAEVDAETMATLGEIQHPPAPNQMQPGGVPGPFGGRRDLNVLIARNRSSQKKRQLRVVCALRARKQAYRIVTELASSKILSVKSPAADDIGDKKSSPVQDMPIILLTCATGEEETSMDPFVTKALEAWLTVYKESLLTVESSRLKTRVAALLPSLLCAVCSESGVARLAAVKWAAEFVFALDPAVTWHVCTFLAGDVDPFISGVAKKALKSMKEDTPMEDCSSSYQTNFFDLTKEEDRTAIWLDLESRVQRTASSLDVPTGAARVVLGDFKFDVDTAVEAYSNDRPATLNMCGLSRRYKQVAIMSEGIGDPAQPNGLCGICYDEVDKDEMYEMPCEHKFCLSCWQSYVRCALDERPAAVTTVLSIICPEQDCSERVVKEDTQVVAPDMMGEWDDIEFRSFIGCSKNYSSCPGPDCKAAAHIPLMERETKISIPAAHCHHCKTSFCFSCGSSPHEPAKCADFAEWNRIFGCAQFWVKKNAKPCPNCNVPIEKNQGCNHIRCSQCQHDFCWLCLGPLRSHMEPHICNRYEPHKSAEDDEERRALFFTDRFEAHDDAQVFARNEVKSFQEKIDKLSAETLWFASDDDLDCLLHAAKTLVQARNFLKNSYVAAWSMRKDLEHRDVFDSHQANLELFTEKLSQLMLTKVHQLYAEQGARAIHMHFRAMLFCTSSLEKYMGRIISFMNSN